MLILTKTKLDIQMGKEHWFLGHTHVGVVATEEQVVLKIEENCHGKTTLGTHFTELRRTGNYNKERILSPK